jgi:hypothetical protein
MTTITLINPWSGAQVERDTSEIDAQSVASLMSDEELYACEGQGDTDAEWLEYVAQRLGAERMGEIVIGS